MPKKILTTLNLFEYSEDSTPLKIFTSRIIRIEEDILLELPLKEVNPSDWEKVKMPTDFLDEYRPHDNIFRNSHHLRNFEALQTLKNITEWENILVAVKYKKGDRLPLNQFLKGNLLNFDREKGTVKETALISCELTDEERQKIGISNHWEWESSDDKIAKLEQELKSAQELNTDNDKQIERLKEELEQAKTEKEQLELELEAKILVKNKL